MTEIYLIRHAQAEGNLYRMMQGHWDGGVTELGRRQIAALGERFKYIDVDRVYSSDLFRARLTGSALLKYHDIPLITDERFREINVGPWETRFFADVAYEQPEEMYYFLNDPDKWYIEGAETYADVQKRAYKALCEIAEANQGKAIAVASHGVTIRCLMSAITGRGYVGENSVPIYGNTSVSKVIYENGGFWVKFENSLSHLENLCVTKWNWFGTMRSVKFDRWSDKDYYLDCYRDSWIAAHGTDVGFSGETYYHSAVKHFLINNNTVQRFYVDDEPAGLLDLDPSHGASEGYGWISLLYLNEKFRHKGLGIQMLGRAYFFFEQLGRKSVRLYVSDDNTSAIAFYKRWGFEQIGQDMGTVGRLLLFEKKLGVERTEGNV